jgi:hypothetical protein
MLAQDLNIHATAPHPSCIRIKIPDCQQEAELLCEEWSASTACPGPVGGGASSAG